MLLSMSGINLAASFLTPRTAAALAEDNLLPKLVGKEGKYGTPAAAIFLTALITLIFAFAGSFTQLATITAVGRFVSYIAICGAAMTFQKRAGFTYRRQPWRFFVPIFALAGIGLMIFLAPRSLTLWCFSALLLMMPFYLLRRWQLRNSGTTCGKVCEDSADR
jgi:amino acid transporter